VPDLLSHVQTLPEIHERYVEEFTLSWGFGYERIHWQPGQWIELVDPVRRPSANPPTETRVYRAPDPRGSGERGAQPNWQRPSYDLKTQTLGYSGGHSAAVQERVWYLRHKQLVSLLRHEHPLVYDTKPFLSHLRVKEGPTEKGKWRIGPNGEWIEETPPPLDEQRPTTLRELDGFETTALDELQRGNELVVKTAGPEMRLLGAVRARTECLSCHEGAPGRLLGAFTYLLELTPEDEQGAAAGQGHR
jgi:hypothetical protein